MRDAVKFFSGAVMEIHCDFSAGFVPFLTSDEARLPEGLKGRTVSTGLAPGFMETFYIFHDMLSLLPGGFFSVSISPASCAWFCRY